MFPQNREFFQFCFGIASTCIITFLLRNIRIYLNRLMINLFRCPKKLTTHLSSQSTTNPSKMCQEHILTRNSHTPRAYRDKIRSILLLMNFDGQNLTLFKFNLERAGKQSIASDLTNCLSIYPKRFYTELSKLFFVLPFSTWFLCYQIGFD